MAGRRPRTALYDEPHAIGRESCTVGPRVDERRRLIAILPERTPFLSASVYRSADDFGERPLRRDQLLPLAAAFKHARMLRNAKVSERSIGLQS